MVKLSKRFVKTNGIKLHVIFAGPEDGKTVLLLHGFPEFWWGCHRQVEPLAESGCRVIVPDQRGYNLSDKPWGVSAYHISTLAKDIIGLIMAESREKAVVIGHDWGAAIAWHLATYFPERVEKLGILNVPHPAVMVQTLRTSFTQLRKSWYMFFFQIPQLPEWTLGRKDARGLSKLLMRSGKPGTFSEADLVRYRGAWTQPGALTGMINWYRSAVRNRFWSSLAASPPMPRIRVPTMILWGVKDVALSSEMAQPSLDLCDEGKLIFFDDSTHWVQHDEAQKVTEHLLDFVS
jgi:pimeloyl-ACP methyl ester carboxylesterase